MRPDDAPVSLRRRASGWSLGKQQLQVLMWRQWLLKKRGWLQTLVEIISPVVIMTSLVIAYHMVDVDIFQESIYTGDTEALLHSMTDAVIAEANSAHMGTCVVELLKAANLTQYNTTDGVPPDLVGFNASDPASVAVAEKYIAQQLLGFATAANGSQELRDCVQRAGRAAPAIFAQWFQEFINKNGPLPLLTMDEFVLLHKGIQSALAVDPNALAMVRGVRHDFGWNLMGNLVDLGGLAFAPRTKAVERLVDQLSSEHVFFDELFMGIYNSEEDIAEMARNGQTFWAGVIFNEDPEPGLGADYTIRMYYTVVPQTFEVTRSSHYISRRSKEYVTSGFLSLELAINNALLGQSGKQEGLLLLPTNGSGGQQPYVMWAAAFPTSAYVYNKFYAAVGPMMGLLMCLSMIFPLAMLIKGLVEEKEIKAREVLFIMGLKPWVLMTGWLVSYMIVFTLVSLISVSVICATFLGSTSFSLLLTAFLLFSVAELSFGVLVSTFFSRAKLAAVVGPLTHFVLILPRYLFYRAGPAQAVPWKLLSSLSAPTAFTFGLDQIADYQGAGQGMQWGDVWEDPYPIGAVLVLLAVDSVLYLVLAWYLDKVLPSEYGPQLPAWFLFSGSYWRTGQVTPLTLPWQFHKGIRYKRLEEVEMGNNLQHSGADDSNGPQPPSTGPGAGAASARLGALGSSSAAVQIQKLRMQYPNGVVAVHGLDLQMQRGRITSLLGHNGAGKSTTVAMMTGLLRPSSGDCTINGHSIVTNTPAARASLGICPQQNVLFESLSVEEHLVMMAAIKGVPGMRACRLAAKEMQDTVGLPADGATKSRNLSGGMKRKLQVGMALIGGSEVVVLDEPTSGMDPSARRALWQLLRGAKRGRALLLTTHFMDEADILSDEVAIMSGGKLCCVGSPMQLKEWYGDGYTLTMTKLASAGFETAPLTSTVHSVVPGARLLRHAAAEVVFRLPLESSALFPRLFRLLESSSESLGIAHYGIAMPTLEEVFLRATAEDAVARKAAAGTAASASPQASDGVNEHAPAATVATATVIAASEVVSLATVPVATVDHDAEDDLCIYPPSARGESDVIGGRDGANEPSHARKTNGAGAGEQPLPVSLLASNGPNSPEGPHQRHTHPHHLRETTSPGRDQRRQHPPLNHHPHQEQQQQPDILDVLPSARSPTRHAWRCFVEMLRKRQITAARDWKGVAYLFLLPVVAVALVLIILTVNIDPTDPELLLTLDSLHSKLPIIVGNAPRPELFSSCVAPDLPVTDLPEADLAAFRAHHRNEACNGLLWQHPVNFTNAADMSAYLLTLYYNGHIPEMAAVVFNDSTVKHTSTAVQDAQQRFGKAVTDGLDAANRASGQSVENSRRALELEYKLLQSALNGTDISKVVSDLIKNIVEDIINNDAADGLGGGRRRLTQQQPADKMQHVANTFDGLKQSSRRLMVDPPTVNDQPTPEPPGPQVLPPYDKHPRSNDSAVSGGSSNDTSADAGGTDGDIPDIGALAKLLADQVAKWMQQYGGNASSWGDLPALLAQQAQVQLVFNRTVTRFRQPPVTLMFNASSFHTLPALMADVHQSQLVQRHRAAGSSGSGGSSKQPVLRVTNHPLPLTLAEHDAVNTFLTILAAIFVLVPFCYLSGAYSVSPVSEARCGSKAMQLGSGCPRVVYWAGSYAWDLATHAAVAFISLSTFAAFRDEATTGTFTTMCGTFLLLFGYGAGVIPLSYCESFGFNSPSSAQVAVSAINFILGFMFVIGIQVMKGIPECRPFEQVAVHFCRLLPPYNLGEGLINLSTYYLQRKLVEDLPSNRKDDVMLPSKHLPTGLGDSPFAWTVLGRNLAALYGMAVVFAALAVALDKWRSDSQLQQLVLDKMAALKGWLAGRLSQRSTNLHAAVGPSVRRGKLRQLSMLLRRHLPRRAGGQGAAEVGADTEYEPVLSRAVDGDGETPTALQRELDADIADLEAGTSGVRGGGSSGPGAAVTAEDPDVAQERLRVAERAALRDAICIRNLQKAYPTDPPKVAVHDLSLAIRRGERFGFLGANGAGKTSTLSIVSGHQAATSGDAFIAGTSVTSHPAAAQHLIGYCPQVDPLLDFMTSREQLAMFCRIKGVPESGVRRGVAEVIARCGMPRAMADRPAGTLSGGNKRKLSLAIALVGLPVAVLLDEPSSGMDPGARRMMWDAIIRATQHEQPSSTAQPLSAAAAAGMADTTTSTPPGAAVAAASAPQATASLPPIGMVLTTHYMEECEALCERVGIMDQGRLVCLGSPQHLKSRFGGCYLLDVYCREGGGGGGYDDQEAVAERQQQAVTALVLDRFVGGRLEEQHFGRLKFNLPSKGLSLARVFEVMEEAKVRYSLAGYSVSQPSLEQVFLAVVGRKLSSEEQEDGVAGSQEP